MKAANKARRLFERAGLRVIEMLQDEFWFVDPGDEERKKYGPICISQARMQAINDSIDEPWPTIKCFDSKCRGELSIGVTELDKNHQFVQATLQCEKCRQMYVVKPQ